MCLGMMFEAFQKDCRLWERIHQTKFHGGDVLVILLSICAV
jgi:hypothetical protein